MNEPSPAPSLRIRPRAAMPGVSSMEPSSTGDGASTPPSPAAGAAPETAPEAPKPKVAPPVQISRPSVTASGRPPVGGTSTKPPITPENSRIVNASRPPMAVTPPAPSSDTVSPESGDPAAGLKLRDKAAPAAPSLNAPKAAPETPPTRAPASTLSQSTPPPAPPPPVYASPLLAPKNRPEDSKLFRVGVKVMLTTGLLLAIAFGWLGWRFVSKRYGAKPAEVAGVQTGKTVVAVVSAPTAPAATPTPKPTPPPAVPLLDEFVARLKISGVAGGARPRAMIDNALVFPGQVIEQTNGIVLERIDTEKRHLHFKDNAGHTAQARY